jgi:hypothetical protein
MTANILSRNEDIYPSATEFRPERFLENPRLDRYQLTFSRGTRRCIGVSASLDKPFLPSLPFPPLLILKSLQILGKALNSAKTDQSRPPRAPNRSRRRLSQVLSV